MHWSLTFWSNKPRHIHTHTQYVRDLKGSVMAVAGADDVTVALQRFEDQLQRSFAHVEAVALPDRRQDVQDVATLLRICGHRRDTAVRARVCASVK